MIYNRPKALVATGADFRRPVRLSTELTKWTGDIVFFFFQAEDGIRDLTVTVQTCALPICLEYPIGKVLHETTGWISNLRFSPKGDHLAFIDHNLLGDDGGTVSVVDLSGKKSDLTERWAKMGRASCRERV